MSDFSDFRRRYGGDRFTSDRFTGARFTGGQARPFVRRARAYLSTRPAESWLFFFAGILAGAILA